MPRVEVTMSYAPFALSGDPAPPTIQIDGGPALIGTWGTSILALTAGRHELALSHRRPGRREVGRRLVQFDLAEGETRYVSYRVHAFLGARITVGERIPSARVVT